jgi:SEC-C motif domain protein
MNNVNKNIPCPCGSGLTISECCGPYLLGNKIVDDTPINVLKTRFTAFVLADGEYILKTWHKLYRPKTKAKIISIESKSCKYTKLEIIHDEINEDSGKIEYIARYRKGVIFGYIHEIANFKKEGNEWFYTDGIILD